ncbi:superoxide dismutase [Cricetulus griseus]|nr:superoxide dismutase [Cricetulus griseus]
MLCRAACSAGRRLAPAATAAGSRHKHSLPDLPYDYGALEPHINAQIMQLHHSKHHAAYVNNLNATEEKYREALAKGELLEAIKRDFGSFEKFKEKLTAVSAGVQGSGWGWLGFNKEQGRLQIAACSNQDPLQGTTGLIPLLGIDVWEHAYYLQYKNVRPDYLKAIWNVINWENVTERYTACKKKSSRSHTRCYTYVKPKQAGGEGVELDKRFMTSKQWKRLLHLAIMHVTSNKEDKKCLYTLILQQFPTTSEVTLTSDYGDQQVTPVKGSFNPQSGHDPQVDIPRQSSLS